ncbi:DUF1153 domain-containing protein [Rhodoferax sp. TBRC 17660]|uniref:DUF1153 domain-containing protein n=1 Tax=Rhodoferax potami TaxID=3068338 RepID=A0ABU3KSH1_9BURK|nr:DUF1153 domain-containing protein [Rhodoferax sp. TBRC 17660]MDT7520770.1 DUF1153 domain-containing protein [Rhodoferax sp. TBRC 17660]
MSTLMKEYIKRWTAKRKTALVLGLVQGKATISEATPAYDLNPSEVEQWVDEDKRGMENALRSKPQGFGMLYAGACYQKQPLGKTVLGQVYCQLNPDLPTRGDELLQTPFRNPLA